MRQILLGKLDPIISEDFFQPITVLFLTRSFLKLQEYLMVTALSGVGRDCNFFSEWEGNEDKFKYSITLADCINFC